jgi:protein ImuB
MFACIYGRTFPKSAAGSDGNTHAGDVLVNLGFTFSPLVERTAADTVVLDIEGQEHLFSHSIGKTRKRGAWTYEIADQMRQCAQREGWQVNVAVAANPDVAIHAAHAFNEITVVPRGKECDRLSKISLKLLDYSLMEIDERRAEEIRETFALWGLRTFGDLARLPLAGVAQRLGQEGVRLQKLARGNSERNLILVQPPIGFEQSLDLEHPIAEVEPLSFILSRLLNQLCANLNEYALATNELRLRLATETETIGGEDNDRRCSEYRLQSGFSISKSPTEVGTLNRVHERTISLPVPMRNAKSFLRLCLLDLESHPPQAPVIAVSIAAEPTKPRVLQNGLFIPLAPEPEKLELTLARLAKLVGPENVGSPELFDTHRSDAFRLKRFTLNHTRGKKTSPAPFRLGICALRDERTIPQTKRTGAGNLEVNGQSAIGNRQFIIGFRRFRPPLPAQVTTVSEQPARINARAITFSEIVRGKIVKASGPWRVSGDWWRADFWARDEWDVTVESKAAARDGHTGPPLQILCRIYRDLASEEWFVEGIYD